MSGGGGGGVGVGCGVPGLQAETPACLDTKKRKRTLFVDTIVLTALLQVSCYSAFFNFAVFAISFFLFLFFFVWFPKNNRILQNQSKEKKRKKPKEDRRWQAEANEILGLSTKQDRFYVFLFGFPKSQNIKKQSKQNKKQKQKEDRRRPAKTNEIF